MVSIPVLTLLFAFLPSILTQAVQETNSLLVDNDQILKTEEGYIKKATENITADSLGLGFLNKIASTIDFSRTCVIGLGNLGNRNLTNPTHYLHHGILRTPLPDIIEPKGAGVFAFEKTPYSIAGTSGMLTYTIEGTNIQVAALWDVPFFYGIESNWFNIQLYEGADSSENWYNKIHGKSEGPLKVWDGGHWLNRNLKGVKVHGSMTNKAKASFLIELEY